ENVTQPTEDVMVVEGQPTKLSCTFDSTDLLPYLFWYIQQANGNPMFMLRKDTFGAGETVSEFKERFHARLNVTAKSVPLTIQRLQLSDSAMYYCALKPTVTPGYTAPLQKHTELHNDNTPVCTVYNTTLKLTQNHPAIIHCLPGGRATDIKANLKRVLPEAKTGMCREYRDIVSHIGTNDVRMKQLEVTKRNKLQSVN
uniref:Ig-like domain-containing protein n=1 Tax=Hucho hucho TaxID=62062 RepID=A0A4W5KL35_9TELE